MNKYKIALLIIWVAALTLGPVAVLKGVSASYLLKNPTVLFSTIQRIAALMTFVALFFYIVLDFLKTRLANNFKNWISNFILFDEFISFLFIAVYQFSFLLVNYFARHGLDPFYVFTDVCVLCANKFEAFNTLARVSFWLLAASNIAWIFKDSSKWLKTNWEKLQTLNYLSFFLMGALLFFTVPGAIKSPFVFFYTSAITIAIVLTASMVFKFVKSLV